MNEKLSAYWSSREPREQVLLMACAVLILIAALYAIWSPLHQAKIRLERRLPQLQNEVTRSQTLASRWATMGGGAAQQDWRAAAQARLVTYGFNSQQAKLVSNEAGVQSWQFENVSFNPFMDWVGSLYNDFGVRIKTIKVTPLTPGQVTINVELNHP